MKRFLAWIPKIVPQTLVCLGENGYIFPLTHRHVEFSYRKLSDLNLSAVSLSPRFSSLHTEWVNEIRAFGGKWTLSSGQKGCSRLICCRQFWHRTVSQSSLPVVAQKACTHTPTHTHTHAYITRAKQQLKRQNYHTRLLFRYFTLRCIPSDTQTTICALLVGVKSVCVGRRVSEWMEVSPISSESSGGGEEMEGKAGNLWPPGGSRSAAAACLHPTLSLASCTHCQPVCPLTHTSIIHGNHTVGLQRL